MMQYVYTIVEALLLVGFAYLFLEHFLPRKTKNEETLLILVMAWIVLAISDLLGVSGLPGLMVYVLAAVLMLLCIFAEEGGRGLFLLTLVILIPLCCQQLPLRALWPIVFVLLLRLLHRKPKQGPSEETEELLLRQHIQMQQESMLALEQNYRVQRKNAHEFEHHMQVLRDLLDGGEVTAAQDYLNRLKKNRSMNVMSISSHHPVVDVILSQKHQTAQESEIEMQIRVSDLSAVDIPSDSLVVVLTNLLDNAIEACRRIDGHREIHCTILYDDGLYLSVNNTSLPVQVVGRMIPTSKQDTLNHGFGLASVLHVLDGLGAEYSFRYEEGWFRFAAEMTPKN